MIKEAIIIFDNESGFLPIFGIPNIQRNISLLRKLGIKKIVVIGKADFCDRLSEITSDHFIYYPIEVVGKEFASIIKKMIKGNAVILKANHVIDRPNLQRFIGGCKMSPCALVRRSEEPILISSKEKIIDCIDALSDGKIEVLISDVINKVEENSLFPFLLKDSKDVKKAESILIKALSQKKRETDSFLAKNFDRNISLFFSKRLVYTSLTPNQVTLMGMSIGLMGALLLTFPGHIFQILGAFLFLFCVIVDGIDGEIARLKVMESKFGHYLDIITDNIVHIAIFIGIGLGLYGKTGDQIYIIFLYILLFGFGLCAISVYQCILKKDETELQRSPLLIKILSFLTNRDFAYLVALLAIFDKLNWFLIATAIGSYMFAISLWVADYLSKKGYPADSSA